MGKPDLATEHNDPAGQRPDVDALGPESVHDLCASILHDSRDRAERARV